MADMKTRTRTSYDPSLLSLISRQPKRNEHSILHPLPFRGYDIWNCYELSWLNRRGKPQIANVEIWFPCEVENFVESKSFKEYLYSFNQCQFDSIDEVRNIIRKDLQEITGPNIDVNLFPPPYRDTCYNFEGTCLDDLDIATNVYHQVQPSFLTTSPQIAREKLYTNLFRMNGILGGCPDWATIMIEYQGEQIDHDGLLKYLISYREHDGFNEDSVEHIFMDILRRCDPFELTVYGLFNRRGGSDINPYRSTHSAIPKNIRFKLT
jgi:7-cyano-7-deazaguanine reductase